MKWFRENKIIKCVWFVFAIHVFNTSIDPTDIRSKSESEDLAINDIETLTELVAENILHIENAVPEHDEKDSEEGKIDTTTIFVFCEKKCTCFKAIFLPELVDHKRCCNNHYSFNPINEVKLPPEIS